MGTVTSAENVAIENSTSASEETKVRTHPARNVKIIFTIQEDERLRDEASLIAGCLKRNEALDYAS